MACTDGSGGFKHYKYCRPRMNHWHAWNGGDCPLPEGLIVDARLRDDYLSENANTNSLIWTKNTGHNNVIAFKVTGIAEGYRWPWE